jgi:hypothetical protein
MAESFFSKEPDKSPDEMFGISPLINKLQSDISKSHNDDEYDVGDNSNFVGHETTRVEMRILSISKISIKKSRKRDNKRFIKEYKYSFEEADKQLYDSNSDFYNIKNSHKLSTTSSENSFSIISLYSQEPVEFLSCLEEDKIISPPNFSSFHDDKNYFPLYQTIE